MKMKTDYSFDWSDLAFKSKKAVKDLDAVFLVAPRQMSKRRFTELIKKYLPKSNLLVGISLEQYVLGLEGQPQFKMLQMSDIKQVIDKVNESELKNKIYVLNYSQRDISFILEKIKPQQTLFVNGSWYHGFHHRPEFYTLINNHLEFQKISPFSDEKEAKDYAKNTKLQELTPQGLFNQEEMMNLANRAAMLSYDFSGLQTGVALGRIEGQKYQLLGLSHNEILPYETYSMHYGSTSEKNFSPLHDLNHYDTVHAEVAAITGALKNKLDLKQSSLFINLLPCPNCTKMLMKTDISEIVYQEDHSDGYALKMLEATGKKARRLVV
jgi:deoxycytidylate deaminase